MEEVGPLIYEDEFLVVQARLHTMAFDIEVLYSKTDYQKHQYCEDDGFDYLTHESIALLKIVLWIHALSFPTPHNGDL
jgi:hypothetical protein